MEISRLSYPRESEGVRNRESRQCSSVSLTANKVCSTRLDCQPEVLSPGFGTSGTADSSCEPGLLSDKLILDHDCVPSHTALSVTEILMKKSILVLEPTHQIPFRASCSSLPWRSFSRNYILKPWMSQKGTTAVLINPQEKDVCKCFNCWKLRWNVQICTAQEMIYPGETTAVQNRI